MIEIKLPKIRKMFVPDPGMTIWDADLTGADAQVVAWEANDLELMEAFRAGLDVHSKNAEDMVGTRFTLADPPTRYKIRKSNKVAVHLTNYGGSARVLAMSVGWTVHESEMFQRRWFSLHPNIREWQQRIYSDLRTVSLRTPDGWPRPPKTVFNKFGYRITYFDRVETLLPQALAWIAQSTVAIVCFEGALQLRKAHNWLQILIQVHDSIVFQTPHEYESELPSIVESLRVPVPYDDPLIIPWSVARSRKSWGECEKVY